MNAATVSTLGRNVTVIIRSANPSDIKTIQLENTGFLFSVGANITLKLQNIVLKGVSSNTGALVQVGQGATLILETGGKISLNTNTSSQMSGGIYINGGNLIMNGGEISDNNGYFRGGGIYVDNMGTVTIQEGVIFRNKTSGSGDMSYIRGGGIYINNNCTVRMNGGTISSNTSCRGGGVYVASSGLFIKRPASGSSTSGIIYGSIGENANSASGNGDAVYRDNGSLHERNATLGYYDEITSQSDTGWE